MPIQDLQEWLTSQRWLRDAYLQVVSNSILLQFPSIAALRFADPYWPALLSAASVLGQSDEGKYQEIALRFAQECLQDASAAREERDSAAIVLDMLANRRAISLAAPDDLLEGIHNRLGLIARLDWTRRSFEHSVEFYDGTIVNVNRFQKRFWEETSSSGWVSASAPTSAGKSYILMRRIIDVLATRPNAVIIYISPTRALVHEVEYAIKKMVVSSGLRANVTSMPLARSIRANTANILVYTQERLHLLFARTSPDLRPDVLIVDEAQKIADGQRGVLLQQALERVVNANYDVDVTFVTPQASNPQVLLRDAPPDVRLRSVPGEDVTVNQNLLWIRQLKSFQGRRWDVGVCVKSQILHVGDIELPDRPDKSSKRLPLVAFEMGQATTGNLVYANGAFEAEKTAIQLAELMSRNQRLSTDPAIEVPLAELADLARRIVHPRFGLIALLRNRVAFHYGNMPFLLRSEIERLFRDGVIRFLVCTSTLVEGVNLACRNIFVRGPTRGPEPMNEADFWNLAGRAGRWGQDRAGNIVCVDPTDLKVWHGHNAPVEKTKQVIVPATDKVLAAANKVIEFILAGTPRNVAGKDLPLEHTAAYLISLHVLGNGGASQMRWAKRFDAATIDLIDRTVVDALEGFDIEASTIARNPGISPLAMAGLLRFFRTRRGTPAELVPTSPEDDDAVTSFYRIFKRIGNHLSTIFSNDKRAYTLALLVVHWMRGEPLPRLIDRQLKYEERKQREKDAKNGVTMEYRPNLPSTIRQVMKDVEEVARFAAPKFLGCYLDVLRQFLQERQLSELVDGMDDFQVLLEYGVSTATELSLLSLGLSRTSAVFIAELMIDTEKTEDSCLLWLRERDVDALDLPAAVRREVRLMLALAVAE